MRGSLLWLCLVAYAAPLAAWSAPETTVPASRPQPEAKKPAAAVAAPRPKIAPQQSVGPQVKSPPPKAASAPNKPLLVPKNKPTVTFAVVKTAPAFVVPVKVAPGTAFTAKPLAAPAPVRRKPSPAPVAAHPLKGAPSPVRPEPVTRTGKPIQTKLDATVVSPSLALLLGQIRDEQGNPVAGATVSLGKKFARTDASGSYVIENLTPGRWEVKVQHNAYTEKTTRIWLVEGLKTNLSLALVRPVTRQPPSRVGLIGVGSLPATDTLAQRLAEDLVRTGAFPQGGPLAFIKRDEVMPAVRKLDHPLFEILDHDRPNVALVKDFFDYLGLSALVVSRVDLLTRNEGDATQLNTHSRVELWQIKDNRVDIRTLADAGRSERQDGNLNKAETDQLYAVQITRQAEEYQKRWERDSPLTALVKTLPQTGSTPQTTTKVEILPTTKGQPQPKSAPTPPPKP
ncbi:carboxypeptidase-like regulatory domain-containing protein [Gloeobacter kilaueensis]|uniref:Peptidase C1A, papain n=1 Tax=Gloeobacter kilaueensis (strain ATCC BAA-2537 / CCAP 1431/1 / ULC 316 / JS1) TaxID=1183438 RepID=U5QLZ0_GLOK1|nr:carboxypeptidase-like regulatory domain-containing protein [Gloeobacter kilaueensis]AGY59926.1 peptidase C1A, papain [Gloeobacter kilaueensis JS1]